MNALAGPLISCYADPSPCSVPVQGEDVRSKLAGLPSSARAARTAQPLDRAQARRAAAEERSHR